MTGTDVVERVWSDVREVVGRSTRVHLGQISQRDLDRFSVAVAGSARDDITGLATQLYLSSVLAWSDGPDERDLLPDGNAADPFAGFDVAGLRLMAGGQELTFHRDLRPGATVTLDVSLASADLKEGRNGRLLVLVVERRYEDERGLLTECRETFLGREALA